MRKVADREFNAGNAAFEHWTVWTGIQVHATEAFQGQILLLYEEKTVLSVNAAAMYLIVCTTVPSSSR